MLGLTALVASVAIADSINPSTIVPALYLATSRRPYGLASFIVGVLIVNVTCGLVLVFGPGPELIAALKHVGPQVEHITELAGGALLGVAGVMAWRSRHKAGSAEPPRDGEPRAERSALALGAGIAAVEMPTAFMYFGAISAILGSHPAVPAEVLLVVAYNLLFVLPLLAILALRMLAGDRAGQRLIETGAWLRRAAPVALATVAGGAGVVLATLGAGGLILAG